MTFPSTSFIYVYIYTYIYIYSYHSILCEGPLQGALLGGRCFTVRCRPLGPSAQTQHWKKRRKVNWKPIEFRHPDWHWMMVDDGGCKSMVFVFRRKHRLPMLQFSTELRKPTAFGLPIVRCQMMSEDQLEVNHVTHIQCQFL